MSDKPYEQIPEVKSLRWLMFNFPIVEKPKDDADRIQSCIHHYCANAVELIKHYWIENNRLMERNNELATKGEKVVIAYKHAKEETIDAMKQKLLDAFPESNRDNICPAIYWEDFVELVESVAEELKNES